MNTLMIVNGSAYGLDSTYTAIRLAAAANPMLRPLSTAVRTGIERWADEHAATRSGDRAGGPRPGARQPRPTPVSHAPAAAAGSDARG